MSVDCHCYRKHVDVHVTIADLFDVLNTEDLH